MPRIFIAILPDETTRASLAAISQGINGAKWTPPDQLHCTLRFIGNVSDDRAREIAGALAEVRMEPLEISVGGVGTFPEENGHRANNVLWVGVQPTEELRALQARVEDALEMIGMRREARPYHPHITVSRTRYADPIGIENWLSEHHEFTAGPFTAEFFVLMESTPGPVGSEYSVVNAYAV